MFHSSLWISLLVLIGHVHHIQADLTRLEFTDCGSTAVTVNTISLTPMPIVRPGSGNLTFSVNIKRPITNFRLHATVVRTVQSLVLPVSCYKVDGTKVGSCEYSSAELCRFMTTWWPQFFGGKTCSPIFTAFGIDCTCPLKTVKVQTVTFTNKRIDIPGFGSPILSYLSTGDFSVKLVGYEEGAPKSEPFFCGTFKYTVKKAGASGK